MMASGCAARRRVADLPFSGRIDRFTGEGSGTVDVPDDATQLVIKCWGPGGGGSRVSGGNGFGGGAGAYCTLTVTIDAADAGEPVLWQIYPVGQGRKGSPGNGVSPNAGGNGAGVSMDLTNFTGDVNAHAGFAGTTTAPGAASTGSISSGGTVTAGPAGSGVTGGTAAGSPPPNVGNGGNGSTSSGGVQTDGEDGDPGCVELIWS